MEHATREQEPDSAAAGHDVLAATAQAAPLATLSPALGLGRGDPRTALMLQRSAGNRAVTQLLQRCGPDGCHCGGTCGGGHAHDHADDFAGAATASALFGLARPRLQQRGRARAIAEERSRGAQQAVGDELQTRGDPSPTGDEIQTRDPAPAVPLNTASQAILQRDFALEVPRPDAVGKTLSETEMKAAIEFNQRVVSVVGEEGLKELRDVLGTSFDTADIDEAFVNAVVSWQAMNRLTEDGKLGPTSAAALFREMGAEGVARGEVDSGATYSPSGTITATNTGGRKSAHFNFRANFKHDPASGVYASCCELRQDIRWDATSAATMGGPPHGGFPAAHPADRWIEDRDASNKRYGRRAGPFSDPQNFDQYLDTNGKRNQGFGHQYRGDDTPQGPAAGLTGSWRFRVKVVDVCNGDAALGGQDFIRVNW